MHYTIHQLRIFQKVAQVLSITKAAEELHLTQPAVSIQLKNLQSQFDLPLIEIVGKKLYITDFGLEISKAADKILEEVNAINYRTHDFKGKLSGRLKISVVSTGKYVIPYFLSGFLKANDGVELQLDVTNKSKVLESLANNEVDFALVSVMPDKMKVNRLGLMQNKLYLVGNRDTPLPVRSYDKKIFEQIPLIFREAGSGTRLVMERYLSKNNIQVIKKMELTTNEAVKQAVIAGMGYSIMPLIGIKNELQNGELHILPVKGFPIKSEWNLIWLKDKGFSMAATGYLKYVKQHKSELIHTNFEWFEKY